MVSYGTDRGQLCILLSSLLKWK